MELPFIQSIVAEWAASQSLIRRAWLYGSRVRGTHRIDSDIDVAVEVDRLPQDDTEWGTFMWVSDGLLQSLELALPLQVDLQFYGGSIETPTIHSGLEHSSILAYERNETMPMSFAASSSPFGR